MKKYFNKISLYLSKLSNKIFWFFVAVVMLLIFEEMKERKHKKNRMKSKLKYFNPIVEESIFGKKITWILREKPLSDEELENL
jgi:hypothetical protein